MKRSILLVGLFIVLPSTILSRRPGEPSIEQLSDAQLQVYIDATLAPSLELMKDIAAPASAPFPANVISNLYTQLEELAKEQMILLKSPRIAKGPITRRIGNALKQFAEKDNNILNKLLEEAVIKKNPAAVELLLEARANPNWNNGFLLLRAAQDNSLEIVKLLLDYRATIPAGKEEELIRIAIINNSPDMVKVLADKGKIDIDKGKALQTAAINKKLDLVKYFVEVVGVNPAELPDLLYNALYASGMDISIIKYLIEKGANPTVTNADGVSSLHIAVYKNNRPLLELLLAKAPKMINTQDKNGLTPLHNAAKLVDPEIAVLLLQKGANPNIVGTFEGKKVTPLDLAIDRGNTDTATALQKYQGKRAQQVSR